MLLTVGDGGLVALRQSDGEVLWQQRGTGIGLPSVAEGTVYVTAGGRLQTLDLRTGEPGWTQGADESTDNLRGRPTVTGSVVCSLYQAYTYVSSSAGIYSGSSSYLTGYDTTSGKKLWHNASVYPSSPPMAVGGRIYTGANYTGGAGTEDVLCCLDAPTGDLIWKRHTSGTMNAPPTIVTDCGTLMAYGGSF